MTNGSDGDDAVFVHRNDFAELKRMQHVCYKLSKKSGWWTDLETGEPLLRNKAELLCLIHSEISETLEGVRKQTRDKHLPNRSTEEVELADAVIRILDYAGGFDLDLAGAVFEKLKYNQQRADHKLENRKLEGGKKI